MLTLTGEDLAAGVDLADALAREEFLVATKGEARRAIAQGGVYLNGARVSEGQALSGADLLHGRYAVVRKGKKAYGLIDARANAV